MNTVMIFFAIGLFVALVIVNKVDKSNKKKAQLKQKIEDYNFVDRDKISAWGYKACQAVVECYI